MNFTILRTVSTLRTRLQSTAFSRNLVTTNRFYAAPPSKSPQKLKKGVDDSIDEPIQFIGSKAASWHARDTRGGGSEEMLWYQPYVVIASVAVFLIYFCILREESDIDRKLEGSLFDHISGLEEAQLIVSYRYNRENGLDVKAIEQRLSELGIDVKSLN